MKIKLLAFGIAADIFETRSLELELIADGTVGDLRKMLGEQYPQLQQLNSYAIALNNTYALDTERIQTIDEVAILPPVSGG